MFGYRSLLRVEGQRHNVKSGVRGMRDDGDDDATNTERLGLGTEKGVLLEEDNKTLPSN